MGVPPDTSVRHVRDVSLCSVFKGSVVIHTDSPQKEGESCSWWECRSCAHCSGLEDKRKMLLL